MEVLIAHANKQASRMITTCQSAATLNLSSHISSKKVAVEFIEVLNGILFTI
jgi:hypothetical protein